MQLVLPHLLRGLLDVLVHPAPFQRRDAGTALLQDVVILKHFQEGVDLLGLADELEDHAVRRKIDDLGLVDAGDLPQLGAVADIGFHLQQQQLPLQRIFVVQHEDLPGDLQPLGLQDQLAEGLFVAGDGDGDAADGGVVGSRDREAVDVEASAAEQAGHPGQNAALVVHQLMSPPPGIMGRTFSSLSIMHSIQVGPFCFKASANASWN